MVTPSPSLPDPQPSSERGLDATLGPSGHRPALDLTGARPVASNLFGDAPSPLKEGCSGTMTAAPHTFPPPTSPLRSSERRMKRNVPGPCPYRPGLPRPGGKPGPRSIHLVPQAEGGSPAPGSPHFSPPYPGAPSRPGAPPPQSCTLRSSRRQPHSPGN